jgi:hypothetical protein
MRQLDSGPEFPPYEGPYDIPVLVDREDLRQFDMTRCTYFAAQATENTTEDWIADLRERGLPFLLLGATAVLHRPSLQKVEFETSGDIDNLFDGIEKLWGVVVETAHVWLPKYLLEHFGLERGAVLRLSYPLFRGALQFQRETMSEVRFRSLCDLATPDDLSPSPTETLAFREWSARQIAAARANFERQRADADREVLDWFDDDGVRHPG